MTKFVSDHTRRRTVYKDVCLFVCWLVGPLVFVRSPFVFGLQLYLHVSSYDIKPLLRMSRRFQIEKKKKKLKVKKKKKKHNKTNE